MYGLFFLVPGEGLEPSSSYEQWILSPSRLPVSTPGQNLEARMGFAPMYNAFAERFLTTWIPGRQIILAIFHPFFNLPVFLIFSKISSIFPASLVSFSSINLIRGVGLICKRRFNFCCNS